jgi:hypothetical protein
MNLANITSLQSLAVNVQIAHWQAPRKTNEHKALGELYDELIEQTDLLAEIALGKEFKKFSPETLQLNPDCSYADLITCGLQICTDIRAELTDGVDDDLENIVADISTALNHAKYFLEL